MLCYVNNRVSDIQRFLPAVENENFTRKFLIFLIFLLKTLIVGTPRQNRFAEAVLMSTQNIYVLEQK